MEMFELNRSIEHTLIPKKILQLDVIYEVEFGVSFHIKVKSDFFLRFSNIQPKKGSFILTLQFDLENGATHIKTCYLDSFIQERYIYLEDINDDETMNATLVFTIDRRIDFDLFFQIIQLDSKQLLEHFE